MKKMELVIKNFIFPYDGWKPQIFEVGKPEEHSFLLPGSKYE